MRRYLLFFLIAPLWAQPSAKLTQEQLEYTRAHYTKYDNRIPMRDGVKLFTTVYVPKDETRQFPILMQRTPYSVAPYGIDNYRSSLGPSDLFTKRRIHFRLPGCARPLSVRGRVHRRATA